LVKANSGKIKLDRQDITKMSIDHRARLGLGRSFQSTRLFNTLTVRNFLSMGSADITKAEQLLNLLSPQIKVKENVSELSVGQGRSVELARLFSSKSTHILLDEPFAGLSQEARTNLISIIKNMNKSHAFLIIDHDNISLNEVSTSIISMVDGKIVNS
jgi:ABC-type branched-subunit amino acid transport system ATPase component